MSFRPHDAMIRRVLADPEVAAGELRAVLPPAIVEAIDWSTLRLEDGALVGGDLSERLTDLAFSVKLAGREARIFVLLEHQSQSQWFFVVRVLFYVARFWERWLSANPDARLLPPVIPVLVAHDDGGWTAPIDLHDVLDLGEGEYRRALQPLMPSLRLALIDDLTRLTDDALDARLMTAGGKLTLATLRDVRPSVDLVATLRRLHARWISRLTPGDPRDDRALEAMLGYIPLARRSDDPDAIARAVRAIEPTSEDLVMASIQQLMDASEARGLEAGRAKGREAGREEGREEGERRVLARLLERRFGALTAADHARLSAADVDILERWADAVLTARTLAEVFSS